MTSTTDSTSEPDAPSPVERLVGRRGADRATEKVKEVFGSSPELRKQAKAKSERCATFLRREVRKGKKLGEGGFSNVYEIESFQNLDANPAKDHQRSARHYMAHNVKRENPFYSDFGEEDQVAKYAIKHLKPDLVDHPNKFITACADLAVETELMLALDHANVLKVKGVCSAGHEGFCDSSAGYFLIVDRLYGTLEEKLVAWNAQLEKYKGMKSFLFSGKKTKKLQAFLAKRLKVAYEVACAMEYLHKMNVIFRDCKSANIGFDMYGNVQLFDFGLARPVAKDWDYEKDPLKRAGSWCYMAPEVFNSKPYDYRADVYSLGVVLWEILSCQCCLDRKDRHSPLPISSSWPDELQHLVRRCISCDMEHRPSMKEVRFILRQQLTEAEHQDGKVPSLEYSSTSDESSL